MRTRDYLFTELDLHRQLRERQLQVTSKVDAIPESQFLISSDQEVVEHAIPQLVVEPIVLQLDATTMSKAETQVDVSGDSMRFFSPGRRGPFHVPGTRVEIDIPYRDEDWIFSYRTNPWSTAFPRAEVKRGSLRISISLPHDAAPEQFKETYDREFGLIKEYVDRAHIQVAAYNERLESLVQSGHRRPPKPPRQACRHH